MSNIEEISFEISNNQHWLLYFTSIICRDLGMIYEISYNTESKKILVRLVKNDKRGNRDKEIELIKEIISVITDLDETDNNQLNDNFLEYLRGYIVGRSVTLDNWNKNGLAYHNIWSSLMENENYKKIYERRFGVDKNDKD